MLYGKFFITFVYMDKYKKSRLAVDYVEHADGYIELKYDEFPVPMSNIKRYRHTLFRLLGLTPCERDYLDWITEQMRNNNEFYYNDSEVAKFVAAANKFFGKRLDKDGKQKDRYTTGTVKQGFKELRRRNLILKLNKASGLYMVNPVFFVKSTKDRDRLIRMVFSFDMGDSAETKDMRLRVFNELKEIINYERGI